MVASKRRCLMTFGNLIFFISDSAKICAESVRVSTIPSISLGKMAHSAGKNPAARLLGATGVVPADQGAPGSRATTAHLQPLIRHDKTLSHVGQSFVCPIGGIFMCLPYPVFKAPPAGTCRAAMARTRWPETNLPHGRSA